MCAQEHSSRRSLVESAPPLSEHAHCQAMVDSTIVDSQKGEDPRIFDTHLERIYTYERDGSECKPGGREAMHPGPYSDTFNDDCLDDDDGSDASQTQTQPSGGVPMASMYGGFGPPPNDDDDIFQDDGDGGEDIVDPVALAAVATANVAIAPGTLSSDAAQAIAAAAIADSSSNSSPSCHPTRR